MTHKSIYCRTILSVLLVVCLCLSMSACGKRSLQTEVANETTVQVAETEEAQSTEATESSEPAEAEETIATTEPIISEEAPVDETVNESVTPIESNNATEAAQSNADNGEEDRDDRLAKSQDGFIVDNTGALFAIDQSGDYCTKTYIGPLYFNEDGKYTSGSQELDTYVEEWIAAHNPSDNMRDELLRQAYDYVRDELKYRGQNNLNYSIEPAHGETGWMIPVAVESFKDMYGNCYHFAAMFTALARGLGYQAYTTAGMIGSQNQMHGWVRIIDDTGAQLICDPETEWSWNYWMDKHLDLFMKTAQDIGRQTGMSYSQLVDPFEAEAGKAQTVESVQKGTETINLVGETLLAKS